MKLRGKGSPKPPNLQRRAYADDEVLVRQRGLQGFSPCPEIGLGFRGLGLRI